MKFFIAGCVQVRWLLLRTEDVTSESLGEGREGGTEGCGFRGWSSGDGGGAGRGDGISRIVAA